MPISIHSFSFIQIGSHRLISKFLCVHKSCRKNVVIENAKKLFHSILHFFFLNQHDIYIVFVFLLNDHTYTFVRGDAIVNCHMHKFIHALNISLIQHNILSYTIPSSDICHISYQKN